MRFGDGRAARRALRRQRDVMGLLHDVRDWSPALTAVRGAALPAGSPRAPLRRALGKRRGLPRVRSASGFQFVLQASILSL